MIKKYSLVLACTMPFQTSYNSVQFKLQHELSCVKKSVLVIRSVVFCTKFSVVLLCNTLYCNLCTVLDNHGNHNKKEKEKDNNDL